MKKIAALLLVAVSGCTWFKSESKKAETALIDCAKAEKSDLVAKAGGVFNVVVDITEEFVQAVAQGNTVSTTERLILKYGTDIVACTYKEMTATTGTGPSTGAMSTTSATALKVISAHGWQYK